MTPREEFDHLRTLQRETMLFEWSDEAPPGSSYYIRRRMIRRMAVLAVILFTTVSAAAHDWYPTECCHDKDCHPVPCEQIVETPQGYVFDGVPFSRSMEKPSKDRNCHVCIFDNGRVRSGLCLFTLQGT